jgi:hypothetical protein
MRCSLNCAVADCAWIRAQALSTANGEDDIGKPVFVNLYVNFLFPGNRTRTPGLLGRHAEMLCEGRTSLGGEQRWEDAHPVLIFCDDSFENMAPHDLRNRETRRTVLGPLAGEFLGIPDGPNRSSW